MMVHFAQLNRREFATLLGGAAAALACPCVAGAQPADAIRQIGVLPAAAAYRDRPDLNPKG
jgi:hypothetical protein